MCPNIMFILYNVSYLSYTEPIKIHYDIYLSVLCAHSEKYTYIYKRIDPSSRDSWGAHHHINVPCSYGPRPVLYYIRKHGKVTWMIIKTAKILFDQETLL